jgi:transposase
VLAEAKRLATVERAFRSLKSVDLNVRPIHHRLPERVRAHVFLVMLAYYVEWHMRQALAPVLFDDEEHGETRSSPVAPAVRSEKAQAKALRKRTGRCRVFKTGSRTSPPLSRIRSSRS